MSVKGLLFGRRVSAVVIPSSHTVSPKASPQPGARGRPRWGAIVLYPQTTSGLVMGRCFINRKHLARLLQAGTAKHVELKKYNDWWNGIWRLPHNLKLS